MPQQGRGVKEGLEGREGGGVYRAHTRFCSVLHVQGAYARVYFLANDFVGCPSKCL